ncbi:MAG TPA: TonB family protein [Candidatus Dormibacteraeota bacterium]|nr:TonB family protein [Candidatus Dormibacteraeota bacterium]
MTSAYASPPPFRFGPADLKANARRFLERALVISALVHLTAAGVFRAAQERARDVLDLRRIPGRVVIVDRGFPPPRVWTPPSSKTGGKGIFEPVNKNVPFPEIDSRDIFNPNTSAIPRERDSGPPKIPGRDLPPPDVVEPAPRVDKLPVVIDAPKPAYPDWAREAGIEGKVILRVLVGTNGSPKQVVVASGSKALADAARDAVRRWKFEPGLVGKEPVEVWVEVPVTFRLSGN